VVCHNPNASSVLGARSCQLNGSLTYHASGVTDNQLRTLNHIGLFSTTLAEADIPSLPQSTSLTTTAASLEHRVRSYIDSNCAHCHRPAGVRAGFDARLETPLEQQGLIRGEVSDTLGIMGGKVVVPSDPAKSLLFHRDNLLGTNQMPPLARNGVHYGLSFIASTGEVLGTATTGASSGGLSAAAQASWVNQTLQLTDKHRAIFGDALVNPCGVSLVIDASRGTFTGGFKLKDGSTVRTVSYQGVLVQGSGYGWFTLPQLSLSPPTTVLSGKVLLESTP
jgi:hypothetical protein